MANSTNTDLADRDTDQGAALVLHRLCIVGTASTTTLASATGLGEAEIRSRLEALERRGWAMPSGPLPDSTTITERGRRAHQRELRNRLFHEPIDGQACAEFAALDEEFKEICAAWQVDPSGTPNDHSDDDYDRSVLDRLWPVHEGISSLLCRLALTAPHFVHYRDRLADAAHRVAKGDRRALAFPSRDSYHDVWMELHQDIRFALESAGGGAAPIRP